MMWVRFAAVRRINTIQASSYISRRLVPLSTQNISLGDNDRPVSIISPHELNMKFPSNIVQVRNYAKGKDKKGKDGKGKQTKIHISDEEMSEVVNVIQLREQLAHKIGKLKEDYIKNLTIRTAVGGIESLPVELEGDNYPLNEVAQVVRKSPQMLMINVAAFPQATAGIVKAIRESGMNLNPQQEDTTIYVPIPKVTREHRENLAKNAKTLCNKCKEQLRDTQNNFIRNVKKKEGRVSEDLIHNVQLKIREMVDSHMREAESLMTSKQNELLKSSS